jgi:hypothetical protein
LIRFEVKGTAAEVIAELEQLMTPGRYYVKVDRVPGESEYWDDDNIVTKAADFDAPGEAAEIRERAAAANSKGQQPNPS